MNTEKVKSKSGSTHYDLDFKQHLKVINDNLCYLSECGLWLMSKHRLGIGAIGYEKAIIEVDND